MEQQNLYPPNPISAMNYKPPVRPRRFDWRIIVIFVGIIGLITGGLVYFLGRGDKMTTFTNNEASYSINHPEDWEVIGQGFDVSFQEPGTPDLSEDDSAGFGITVIENVTQIKIEAGLSEDNETYDYILDSVFSVEDENITERRNVNLANREGRYLRERVEDENGKVFLSDIYMLLDSDKDRLYFVILGTSEERFSQFQDTFQKALDSFTLL